MKKIIIYVIAACLFLLHSASGCYKESEDCHRFIHLTNNSGSDLYYRIRIFDEIGEYNPALAPEMFKIKNNETEKLLNSTGYTCYESYVSVQSNKIYLFLFESKIVENYPWETVRKENLYLKKYALTIDELNKMNWKIIFTGE